MFGEKDDRVGRDETDALFANLQGPKTLRVYPHDGHNVFSDSNQPTCAADVTAFLSVVP
jgi:esterase/lipase